MMPTTRLRTGRLSVRALPVSKLRQKTLKQGGIWDTPVNPFIHYPFTGQNMYRNFYCSKFAPKKAEMPFA